MSNQRIILQTSENQFKFELSHSTEQCIYVIKFYRDHNTPVSICFIDIKSVFTKSLERDMPAYLVLVLQHWYINHPLCVRRGAAWLIALKMGNGFRQGPASLQCVC